MSGTYKKEFRISEEGEKKVKEGKAEYTAGGIRDKKTKKIIELAKQTEVPVEEKNPQANFDYPQYDDYGYNENEESHLSAEDIEAIISACTELLEFTIKIGTKATVYCIENDIPNKVINTAKNIKTKAVNAISNKNNAQEIDPNGNNFFLSSNKNFLIIQEKANQYYNICKKRYLSHSQNLEMLTFVRCLTEMNDTINKQPVFIVDDIGFQDSIQKLSKLPCIKALNRALEENYMVYLDNASNTFWHDRYGFKKYNNKRFNHIKAADLKSSLRFNQTNTTQIEYRKY